MAGPAEETSGHEPEWLPGAAPPLVFKASASLLPLLLVAPFLAFVLLKCFFSVPVGAPPEWQRSPWAGTRLSYVSYEWIALASSILFFGAIGATTSAFTRAGVEVRTRQVNLIAVQALGSIFAGVLALMFLGGLVQGSIFPQFTDSGWSSLSFDISSWARLLVWSFLAGFSERLVPNLLDRLVRQSREEARREGAAAVRADGKGVPEAPPPEKP